VKVYHYHATQGFALFLCLIFTLMSSLFVLGSLFFSDLSLHMAYAQRAVMEAELTLRAEHEHRMHLLKSYSSWQQILTQSSQFSKAVVRSKVSCRQIHHCRFIEPLNQQSLRACLVWELESMLDFGDKKQGRLRLISGFELPLFKHIDSCFELNQLRDLANQASLENHVDTLKSKNQSRASFSKKLYQYRGD
jgi:hypothetical protein